MYVYDTASHQVMQYQPLDGLSIDQNNKVFLDGDINESSHERAFTPYKNNSPTDTFESDWYGDVDDCINDDSNANPQSTQRKDRSYINAREQPSPQKTKSAVLKKPLEHRKSVSLRRPTQRLEEHDFERGLQPNRSPKSISDNKHVIRSLQMQLRKATDTILICRY